MNQPIVDTLKDILVQHINVDVPKEEIGLDDGLQAVHGLDSIGFVELRFQCEQAYKIVIKDEHFIPNNFKNLRVLSSLIEQLQGA